MFRETDRAFLKAKGKTPVAIDTFTISAMTGARLDKLAFSR